MSRYVKKSVRAMSGYTPGEQPQGAAARQVIKLNTNENPYPPSPGVRDALSNSSVESLRLYPDPLSLKLRRKIAQVHGCTSEQTFAGNGSDEILALCSRAFVEDDGIIGFFEPSYSLYPVFARIRDVSTRSVELGPDFEWQMPEDYSASLFFLSNPNAPTGILYPRETVRSFCTRFKGVVVIDEAYVAFSGVHCMDLALESDNVLVVRTLSKSHSLAGIRLGYAVGPVPLIQALLKIKDSYNLDRITQEVGFNALSDPDTVRKNVERIKQTRSRLVRELEKQGFKVYPSETNFLWVRPACPPAWSGAGRPAGMSAEEFCRGLREHNILVRYFPGPRTGSFLRITVGTDKETDALLAATKKMMIAK